MYVCEHGCVSGCVCMCMCLYVCVCVDVGSPKCFFRNVEFAPFCLDVCDSFFLFHI